MHILRKSLFLAIAATVATTVLFGQTANTFPSTGNVGIGTANPLASLSVTSNVVIGSPYHGDASLHITAPYGCCGRYTQMDTNGLPSQNILNLIGSTDSDNNAYYFAWGVNSGRWTISPGISFSSAGLSISESGSVGIGTTSPGATLEVNGNVKLTPNSGASISFQDGTTQSTAYTGVTCGGDFAESVDVTGLRKKYKPGDLLVIDPKHPGEFQEAAQPYSTLVAGVYSTKPGYVGRRLTGPKSPDEVPLAMVGIVAVKVTAGNGPIRTGDLLVASSTPGRAMKGTDRSRLTGAVVGKALGDLDSGTGTIEALVTLQ